MNVFVTRIAFSKRLLYTVIKKITEKVVCNKKGIVFIDNGNISNMDLYQDDLHWKEKGKCLLATNFIFALNNFFLLLLDIGTIRFFWETRFTNFTKIRTTT